MSPRLRRWALVAAIACGLPVIAHFVVRRLAHVDPPALTVGRAEPEAMGPDVRRLGSAWTRRHGAIREVHLSGAPEEIGWAHSRLLYEEMVKNEGVLLGAFEQKVSPWPVRVLLLDLAQLRYRDVADGMSVSRRREIAAGALGFSPDPYQRVFPTYQRFLYLNALYDIALSYERSPLIGCTTFTFQGAAAKDGHTLLARSFDFEVDDIFDREKAVFFVRESGKIPFASIAWPGLVGVVSGINAEGLSLVVHGGRAGEASASGEPVVHALRRVLSEAGSVADAVRALGEREPMVSHIVVLADARGNATVVERVPGRRPHSRPLGQRGVVTNHFEGPDASDPKNQWVRDHTSTLARRARGDELSRAQTAPADAAAAVGLLRDRRAAGGGELPIGDRRAIDALIATHGVVFDATARKLWVSEGPHLLGRFLAFDLRERLNAPVGVAAGIEALPADVNAQTLAAQAPR